ncbi:MAG: FtsX-like permease family protein [Oscillospiraceae bacterium]|jgi:putative ABC transport system permease protein|nr:FtsX-like permease family protein [Oscillospiraceae bacterium]
MLTLKMIRDMARNKMQFVSIFLMAFIALFIYAGVGGDWRGLKHNSDSFYRETNLADVWLYNDGFTDAAALAIESLEGVSSVERRLELTVTADNSGSSTLTLYFVEKGAISKPYLMEGEPFDPEDKDGVWLDKRFADANGLTPGDTIGASLSGYSMSKTIRGLIYSPEHVYEAGGDAMTPDFAMYGHAYLSRKAFPLPFLFRYSAMLIETESAVGADFEERVADALRGADSSYTVYLEQANHPSVSIFENETQQHKMIGDLFPVVFLAIALLTILTTMTRIVASQRTQIGVLKALGFTKSAITRHYTAYGFFLALAGAALGAALGPLALPSLFFPSLSSFYTLPEWETAWSVAYAWAAAGVAVMCAAVTWLAVHRLLAGAPAETMRPKPPSAFRHNPLERTKLWRRLGFNAQWNIRDAPRNPVRSAMAVVGVFGCAALVVCALSMNDSMLWMRVWQYETINRYAAKLAISANASTAEIDGAVSEVNGEAVMEASVEIRANGVRKSGALLVTDGVTLIQPTDVNMKPSAFPDGAASITLKMAQSLEVRQGDTVQWRVYGEDEWLELTIGGIHREPVSQGLTMPRAYFESLGLEYRPTAILTPEVPPALPDGVDFATLTSDSAADWDDLTEAMRLTIYLLIIAAAILSIVVLYNLGLMSFTEMERGLATLKVLGFKSGALRGLLLTQNLWFSAVGFALGVPGGLWLTRTIVALSGETFDFPVSIRPLTLLAALMFTFGLSLSVNMMFSRKTRRINMVESLKAME